MSDGLKRPESPGSLMYGAVGDSLNEDTPMLFDCPPALY